ncbi:MAG: hypothetical protein AAF193_01635, partial [Bacteroidota bacterium]
LNIHMYTYTYFPPPSKKGLQIKAEEWKKMRVAFHPLSLSLSLCLSPLIVILIALPIPPPRDFESWLVFQSPICFETHTSELAS